LKRSGYKPAAGDAGGALGVALIVWYRYLNNNGKADNTNYFQKGSYLGPSYANSEVEAYLNTHKLPHQHLSDDDIPEVVANLIAQEKVAAGFGDELNSCLGRWALGALSVMRDLHEFSQQ